MSCCYSQRIQLVECLCFGLDVRNVHLIEEVGRGTYGVVHKAVWRGSIVAAKVLSSPSSQGITEEIESFM